jgi:uncharacterized membrane protein (DUF485 family)
MSETASQNRNAHLGIRLFLLYALFYLAFMLVNAFAPQWGEWEPIDGLNLAILWGFALIGSAFVLAMIYGIFCQNPDNTSALDRSESEGKS